MMATRVEAPGRAPGRGELVLRRHVMRLAERDPGLLHVCLTHLHLDHVEGLGFFGPLWMSGWKLQFWGPPSATTTLRDRISRYLSPPLFPVGLSEAPAEAIFEDVPREPWRVGSALIEAETVEHRGPTVGYRIEDEGQVLVYLPDHEPYLTAALDDEPEWISGWALAARADLLLHDSQYTEDEYPSRVGWGHSSIAHVVTYAQIAAVKSLLLFHHDPLHDDDTLDAKLERARELWGDGDGTTDLAREGLQLELG